MLDEENHARLGRVGMGMLKAGAIDDGDVAKRFRLRGAAAPRLTRCAHLASIMLYCNSRCRPMLLYKRVVEMDEVRRV